jgi:hypothetical protein
LPAEDGGLPAEDGGSPADDGGTAAADGGNVNDPCMGITDLGRCMSAMVLQLCEYPTDGSGPRLLTQTCAAGEACQTSAEGKSSCVLTAACRNNDTECQDTNNLRTCVSNAWMVTPCPNGCVNAPVGAACASGIPTQMASGSVVFERRDINAGRTALGDITTVPARGFTVTVNRAGTLIATTTTSITDGTFSVGIPSALDPGDTIKVAAIANEGNNVAYLVADPGFAAGTQPTNNVNNLTAPPRVWSWEFAATQLMGGSTVLTIQEAGSSGQVANVFDKFGAAYREMKTRYGAAGAPIIIWMGDGVAWDCGACQGEGESNFFGTRFLQHMWYPADQNKSAYADPVILHEAGHWVMAAYGRSPGEGGGHAVQCSSFPGLAWSDGFATWFGQFMVNSPIYFDIQGGLFWYDVSARTYDGNPNGWPRPSPTGTDVGTSTSPGLLQKISEGEVTAMLYQLSMGSADANPILQALATPRMTKTAASGGFERAYTRHLWDFNINGCMDSNVRNLSEPAPIFPDLLDAMMCAGFARDRMDAATQPTMYYPYPSGTPLCRQ